MTLSCGPAIAVENGVNIEFLPELQIKGTFGGVFVGIIMGSPNIKRSTLTGISEKQGTWSRT